MGSDNKNTEILKKFGARMTYIRRSKGISQEKFAYESGLARSHVSGIERGKVNLSLSTIEIIAKTLDVEIKAFFDFNLGE